MERDPGICFLMPMSPGARPGPHLPQASLGVLSPCDNDWGAFLLTIVQWFSSFLVSGPLYSLTLLEIKTEKNVLNIYVAIYV